MTENGDIVEGQRTWDNYPLAERVAPWKVFLPVDCESPVLAVGLEGKDLASLARTYGEIDTYQCTKSDIAWAREQGRTLGYDNRFYPINERDFQTGKYCAIAAKAGKLAPVNSRTLWGMLKSGGAVAWIGRRQDLPAFAHLRQLGFHRARKYAFLTDIVLIPIGDRRFTNAGFQLLLKWPKRAVTRILKKAFLLLISLGCPDPRNMDQVMVAWKQGNNLPNLLDWLSNQFGRTAADLSIRSGWNRMMGLVLGENGQILGYAKIPETPMGCNANRKEAQILKKLKNCEALSAMVPTVLSNGGWQGHKILLNPSEGFDAGRCTLNITRHHITFLNSLAHVHRRDLTLNEWPVWQEICHWGQQRPGNSVSKVEALQAAIKDCAEAFRYQKIPFHLIHGDFAPWNILLEKKGLLVVDWEWSEPMGLPFYDLIRFGVSRTLLSAKKPFPVEHFLHDPVGVLKIEHEFKSLRASLKFSADIVNLSALYECWVRRQWKTPLI